MSETHKTRVTDLAKKLAQLSTAANGRFNAVFEEIYSLASSRMDSQLGSSGYGDYVALFESSSSSRDSEYYELSKGERKLRMLETAEAYYLLYYFVLSLRELQNKSVLLDVKEFGDGSLKPSEVNELIRMRHQYLKEGDSICSSFGYSGGVNVGSV
jgi:hypothetical protein